MQKLLLTLGFTAALGATATAAVYINEVLPNAPGSDTGNEYVELRGTPNLLLTNYYLLSLEGQGTGKGDINQYFDLTSLSLGQNGYLFIRQAASKYTDTDPLASVAENSSGTGFGQANTATGSTVGHNSDAAQVDIENGATTILLVKIGATALVPTNTMDLDTNNDGFLDLPEAWTVEDSVGIMDGASAAATDSSYGTITFKVSGQLGDSVYGNIIDVPGPMTTTAGTFWVGRIGESTGATSKDWMGSVLNGSAASPNDFYFVGASDSRFDGRLVRDMKYGGPNALPDDSVGLPFTPTINGGRYTNFTEVKVGGTVGAVAVDPRDKKTILFTIDAVLGGIYKATKVASGNWTVDPVAVVTNLNGPAGFTVQNDGTIWWVHDATMSLMRLKAPWASNTPETVITNFGPAVADDDPWDVAFTPANFNGTPGKPNWLVIADRGSDANNYNALNLLDPSTTALNQTNETFLVSPTTTGLGFGRIVQIGVLPSTGEIVVLTDADGYINAVDANGSIRPIIPTTFWPLGSFPLGAAMAVDPTTSRIWVADDTLDEVWSIDSKATGQTADKKELSFPLLDPLKTYQQINFHEPGMAFAQDGSFLVVADSSASAGGGRLLVFHSEPIVVPSFSLLGATKTASGIQLNWGSAGPVTYNVLRGTDLKNLSGFTTIATNLTDTTFTDTNAPANSAFYRIVAQ